MGERKSVNFRSPVTWLVVGGTLLTAIAIGIIGDRAGRGRKGERSASKREPAAQLERLIGDGFSIPIPRKFYEDKELARIAAKKKGRALFAVGRKKVPDAFRGSIVVIPVPPTGHSLDRYDGTKLGCTESLRAMGLVDGSVKMVTLPAGRFCQLVGKSPDQKTRGATFTFFKQKGVDHGWGLTCNYDTRDDIAQKACDVAVRGWRFEK